MGGVGGGVVRRYVDRKWPRRVRFFVRVGVEAIVSDLTNTESAPRGGTADVSVSFRGGGREWRC